MPHNLVLKKTTNISDNSVLHSSNFSDKASVGDMKKNKIDKITSCLQDIFVTCFFCNINKDTFI